MSSTEKNMTPVFTPFVASNSERGFALGETAWEALLQEPQIHAMWEKSIADELALREEKVRVKAREDGFAAGKAEGYAVGIREAAAAVAKTRETFEGMMTSFDTFRYETLREEERAWLRALATLMTRFVVRDQAFTLDAVQAWVRDNIDRIGKGSQFFLDVSPSTHALLVPQWAMVGVPGCELHAEPELTDGQLRFRFAEGEFFFSKSEQLEDLMNRLESTASTAPAKEHE